MPIRFFIEEVPFKLTHPNNIRRWINKSVGIEKRRVKEVNYIFCSDEYLLSINEEYLRHDTFTDIITFDYSEGKSISGEIFISIDRVSENSKKYRVELQEELHRVMIHGIMHLCGYKDKKTIDKSLMREKEEAYLSLWKKMFHVKR